MKELTRAEEEVMQILWKLDRAFVKEIIKEMDEPKPAYNTVSTIIRILEKKGFVAFEAFGKTHQYYPLVKKKEYSSQVLDKMVHRYFGGSAERLLSFFVKDQDVSVNDLEEILKTIDQKK